MNKINLDSNLTAELLVLYYKDLPANKKQVFMETIAEGNSELNNFLNFIKQDVKYKDPEHGCKVGDTIQATSDFLWTRDLKYYEENNLILDGKVTVEISGFKFFPEYKFLVKVIKADDKHDIRELYTGYVKKLDLI
tara:strand:+ start:2103 stop:2510 length:408 start_codon:yes stop_codon:yes gene_type:complete